MSIEKDFLNFRKFISLTLFWPCVYLPGNESSLFDCPEEADKYDYNVYGYGYDYNYEQKCNSYEGAGVICGAPGLYSKHFILII